MQLKFENVRGYSTYLRAARRGAEVCSPEHCYIVVALPNGRFAPAILSRDASPTAHYAHLVLGG